jgi:hypothetical protein
LRTHGKYIPSIGAIPAVQQMSILSLPPFLGCPNKLAEPVEGGFGDDVVVVLPPPTKRKLQNRSAN